MVSACRSKQDGHPSIQVGTIYYVFAWVLIDILDVLAWVLIEFPALQLCSVWVEIRPTVVYGVTGPNTEVMRSMDVSRHRCQISLLLFLVRVSQFQPVLFHHEAREKAKHG